MEYFKVEFLNLAEEVRKTGIVEQLLQTKRTGQFKKEWKKFCKMQKPLISEICVWEKEYTYYLDKHEETKIFQKGEKIEYPLESLVIIEICQKLTEYEIFEYRKDITREMREVSNQWMTLRVANLIDDDVVICIDPHKIFKK